LGSNYPKSPRVGGNFDNNVRYFYKTKGRAHREAVGLAFVFSRMDGKQTIKEYFKNEKAINDLVKSGHPRPSLDIVLGAKRRNQEYVRQAAQKYGKK